MRPEPFMDQPRRLLSRRPPIVIATLAAAVLALNANALRAFFVGDDFEILFKATQSASFAEACKMTFMKNWGPLSYGQFYLNWRLAGFDPLVYHLTNLAWLTLLVVAFYAFVRIAWPERPRAAWTAALLFLTHPANDQVVANISGRSHIIAVAMALVAFAAYAACRLRARTRPARVALFAGALVSAFLAGLSKESAMTLPAWIAAFEWLVVRPVRGLRPGRSFAIAIGSAVSFFLAAISVFVVRGIVLGTTTPKLAGESVMDGAFRLGDLAVYALLSGLPFPFAWTDKPVLQLASPLGWAIIVLALASGVWIFCKSFPNASSITRASALGLVGLTIAVTTLLPVFWADLQLQRRYVFIAGTGTVLMALAVLERLHERWPRFVKPFVVALIVAGAVGTVQRNDLYRRAGDISRDLIEKAFAAPIEELPLPRGSGRRSVSIVTVPRTYGGDTVSGAILLHRTDIRAALWLFGSDRPDLDFALKAYYAEDYTSRVEFSSRTEADLLVTFRTQAALDAALARDPEDDQYGGEVEAELVVARHAARELHYRLRLDDDFWDDENWIGRRKLLLYSDERFIPLAPPS